MAHLDDASDIERGVGLQAEPAWAGGPGFDEVDKIVSVRVADIDLGERLRPVDPVWAAALGKLMARDGQDEPISVCRLPGSSRWLLVAGAHRLTGAQLEDIEYLRAVITGPNKLERRRREIAENLHRAELAPVDRATFVAELYELLRVKAGVEPGTSSRALSAGARWRRELRDQAGNASEIVSHAYGFTTEIAEQLGLGKRSIELDLLLHRRLAPQALNALQGARHPILRNATQLRALAKLDWPEQAAVARQLVAPRTGNWQSLGEALAHVRGKPKIAPDVEAKRLSAFIGAFSRMSLAERKGAIAQLAGMLPAGVQLVTEPGK